MTPPPQSRVKRAEKRPTWREAYAAWAARASESREEPDWLDRAVIEAKCKHIRKSEWFPDAMAGQLRAFVEGYLTAASKSAHSAPKKRGRKSKEN